MTLVCFFFQAEDGIRDLVRSRGLGDVYKRQYYVCGPLKSGALLGYTSTWGIKQKTLLPMMNEIRIRKACLLYTSDAADERSSVDLGGRRIIKKKKKNDTSRHH